MPPLNLQQRYARLATTVEPACEPVTPSELLSFCLYEGDDAASTEIARSLLLAAREYVEQTAAIACITQTRELRLDDFPCGPQELHVHPVQAVESVEYVASDGTVTTIAADQYQLDAHNIPARVKPTLGNYWPVAKCDTFQAFRLTFTCGYGDDADSVPEQVKLAIKLKARSLSPQWGMCGDEETADNLIARFAWRPTWL